MKKDKYIQLVMDEISRKDKVDVTTLSNVGLSSRNKLYRDFCTYTGHSINEYIRKNRLSKALTLIKASDLSLVEIAYGCGYSSQQALCREVKNYTSMTPLEYKESDVFHYLIPFFNENQLKVMTATHKLPQTICLKYLHNNLIGIENAAINRFFVCFPEYKEILLGRNGKQIGSQYCYELYIERLDDYSNLMNDFVIGGIMPATNRLYATITLKNDEKQINEGWDYLYGSWLSNSMYECTEEPYFEEYIMKGGKISRLKLYIPIQKRKDYINITIEKLPAMQICAASAKGRNAEEISSKAILSFLSEYFPYILQTGKKFFVEAKKDSYTCGILLNRSIKIPKSVKVNSLIIDDGIYAILHINNVCDYKQYERVLTNWLTDNGFIGDKVFVIYDSTNGQERPKMSLYSKINNLKNETI